MHRFLNENKSCSDSVDIEFKISRGSGGITALVR